MKVLLCLLVPMLLLLQCHQTKSANILALFQYHGKSHYIMFEALIMALAEKGHHIDLVTHFPPKKPVPNINVIDISSTLPVLVGAVKVSDFHDLTTPGMIKFLRNECGIIPCQSTFDHPQIIKLKSTNKQYDVILTEIFGSDCMLGFAHLFQTPVIAMTSSVVLPWATQRFGIPDNPAYIPNYFVSFTDRMSLWERVQNTIIYVQTKFLYEYYHSKDNNAIAKSFFGDDLPDLEDLYNNISLHIVNSHLSINYARPVVPNFIEAGGLHIKPPKPLTKHFEEILTTDTKGIIYLTMGSLIMTESFPFDKLQGMFDAFAQLPYKVLWKAIAEKMPKGLKIPKNIHFEAWMPQMEILCHPNVKMFVSHGGLLGTQEATYCGVPRLGIPLFADQENNIQSAERLGIAVKVVYEAISKETILSAARKILEDGSFMQNAKRISEVFRDRPISALNEAVFWTEYVIRHKGAPHLRTAGADLSWCQYFLIDVGFILISAVLIPLFMVGLVLRWVFRKLVRKTKVD